MSTRYSAPLPFRGQKRNFASRLRQALDPLNGISLIVDCFGGSGLLSRVAKDAIPQATVIYNDFDSFRTRLGNIPETEMLRQQMMELLGDQYQRGKELARRTKSASSQSLNSILMQIILPSPRGYSSAASGLHHSMDWRRMPGTAKCAVLP